MQSLSIKSRSKFVCSRLTSNNFDGASHVLLHNLQRELDQNLQVTWVNKIEIHIECDWTKNVFSQVLSKNSEHGAKEAETLANTESARG
jgi:hypothetical protein